MMKNIRSFTITEILIAITIFMLLIGGSIVLIQQTISAITLAQSRLVAYSLAQEGIEIVRNIRDNNWLEQRDDPLGVFWDRGLGNNEYQADYQSTALAPYSGRFLSFNDAGFYSYNSVNCPGDSKCTRYTRKITIEKYSPPPPEPKYLYITSTVQWNEKGNNHTVEVSERLYNWYGSDAVD